MDFWQRLDALVASHELVIDRPRGSAHPRFLSAVYPLDYGYLQETSGGDGNGVDVWRGSQVPCGVVGGVCTVDSLKGDAELKVLLGCTEQEISAAKRFHDGSRYMSSVIVRRGERRAKRQGERSCRAAGTRSRRRSRETGLPKLSSSCGTRTR